MGHTSRAGFTILETMLFLGITGLLIIVLVSGAGVGINVQRYRDATESFKSLIQQQFADLSSVENGRASNKSCGLSAQPVTGANNTAPGQSDCMIVGRYLRIEDENISIYDVTAYENSRPLLVGANDITTMVSSSYTYNTPVTPDQQKKMDWGTHLNVPPANDTRLGILVIRSPYTGEIYSFTSTTVPADGSVNNVALKAMMSAAGNRTARVACVVSDGLFVTDDQSIYINANANAPSAVEVRSNDLLPGGTQC